VSTEGILEILGIADADRGDCVALLAEHSADPAVHAAMESIRRSFGSFNEIPVEETTQDEFVWLTAYLLLTPTVVEWHREQGIPDEVMRDTLADVGRHVAISRRVTGEFSLQTWRWLLHHFTVRIFALGRLQFALQRATLGVDGVFAPGDWILAVHIPESGPLLPAAVDASLEQARAFFPRFFPDKPVSVVTCDSWMLDPFLIERTTPTSNIGSFIRRFSPIGHFSVGHTDALYFVFRTRDLDLVPTLPRETSLQRAVIERLELGQSWEVHWGYLLL